MEEKKARYNDWRLLLAGLLLGGGYLWGTLTHPPTSPVEFSGTLTGMKEVSVQLQQGTETYIDVTFDNGQQMLFGLRDASKLLVGMTYKLELKTTTGPTGMPLWRIVRIVYAVGFIPSSLEPRH